MFDVTKGSRLQTAITCHNALCPIILLAVGILSGITGIVVAAVGFGKQPKDMYDNVNLSMRVAGLILIGLATIPVVISIICWWFYCSNKRAAKSGSEKEPSQAFIPMETVVGDSFHDKSATGSNIYRPRDASNKHDQNDDVVQPYSAQNPNASESVYSEQYPAQLRGSEAVASVSLRPSDSDISSKGAKKNSKANSGKPADKTLSAAESDEEAVTSDDSSFSSS